MGDYGFEGAGEFPGSDFPTEYEYSNPANPASETTEKLVQELKRTIEIELPKIIIPTPDNRELVKNILISLALSVDESRLNNSRENHFKAMNKEVEKAFNTILQYLK